MTDRIIDIADQGADLKVRHEMLVIGLDGDDVIVPLVDIAVLIAAHPAVKISQAVLSGLCRNGGVFIVCNEKRLPAGMLLPIDGHFVQTERFAKQARASQPLMKGMWKSIVKAKVHAQGNTLLALTGEDHGLLDLSKRVRSGDTDNMEAQAARRYWPALFGKDFRRDFESADENRMLNYGYAILRGITARAICAAGLHPSLGIHHHNRYNPFCLADDLMEPFRPLVDSSVYGIVSERGRDVPLCREIKTLLIRTLSETSMEIEGECRSFFDAMARVTNSLASVFTGKRKSILLPQL